ncbi:TonB-linked SusC/RagA family outer membrane protein [Winogradskyella epiphytica]|uniref:TonB-linked SusC/RagA family outer membrane protein n=1 Tax=Winogradskyella epiphytica TaxID=262005 RepID=A0A2V4WUS4_9FLAO|nr:TonB-dependent receptor [Winogradskyella epiphytica]PYE80490.1 TonB-linked SusC/RagA family outer membrane protein [Winogradskyella epiphytica]GGW69091.1 SusC/RagA family TonB-linked outer membrane protein [Winogradskyella epiphytica]
MKTKFKGILTLLLVFLVQLSFAQEKSVSGVVSDESGLPLPGVNIIIKGTNKGTQTNFDGEYTLTANVGNVLVISYIGLRTEEVRIGSANTYNITLTEDASSLDEVVVVAFGTTSMEAFTGSASVIGEKDLSLRSVTSPVAAIEGKATGVQFTSASGQPGSSPGIVIRGVGTLNGSATPLFIVDGVQYEGSLNTLNQDDIKSFTILKDAASTSLYGSRAANGVVLITTKSGNKGGIKTNISVQTGFVTKGISEYEAIGPHRYYETMWEALRNSSAAGGDPAFASANIYNQLGYNPFNVPNDQIVGVDGRINPNAEVIYKSLDWYDAMERTGLRTNYSVNVAGGGEKHQVFFSASYLDEEGYVVTSDFDRLTARLNADFDASDWLTLGGSANISLSESNGPASAGTSSIVNPFGFAKGLGSIYPVYVNDLNGNLVRDVAGNPIFDDGSGYSEYNIGTRPTNQGRHALQELLLNDEVNRNNTYGLRFYADAEVFKGLNFRVNYSRDIQEGLNKSYENHIIGDGAPGGRYGEDRYRRQVENFNQILTYSTSINDIHNIDITAGHESFDRTYSSISGSAITQVATGIYEFDNFSQPVRVGGSTTNKTLEGYFLRANYNFDNKYYISASARRDASSVFDKKSRWGNFYSIGGSWRVDQENFMENVSFIDKLKLRASYGEVGNDNLGDFFLSQPRYGLTSNAGNPALVWEKIGNADLQWEAVSSWDVALEFTMFNNFLDGSIEYYKKSSSKLLYNLPLPLSIGLDEFPTNIGGLYNAGWEVGLTAHLANKQDFKWDVTLQGSSFKNEITDLPSPFINGSKRWEVGRSRYDYYIYHTAGVDPDNGDQLFYMFEIDDNGDSVPVLDANGNQETTNDYTETERAYTGDSSIPDFLGSISNSMSYKGFSLDFLITYGIGGKILDGGYSSMMHSGSFGRSSHPDILNAWREPGDITDVPRLETGSTGLVVGSSTRFLTDASFWSLKNVNLGYTFDKQLTDALNIDNLRLYVSGENLYIKSKRKGLDPQYSLSGTPSGIDYNPARIFSLGLNVSF